MLLIEDSTFYTRKRILVRLGLYSGVLLEYMSNGSGNGNGQGTAYGTRDILSDDESGDIWGNGCNTGKTTIGWGRSAYGRGTNTGHG